MTLSSRTFGIEIEFAGDQGALQVGMERAGLPVNGRAAYSSWMRNKWTVKSDGSVDYGGELASPVFDFYSTSDRQQVTRALEVMTEVGCGTTEQAGIHIHVGTHGLEDDDISSLAYAFVRYEDFLYRMAASGWRSGLREAAHSYAHPYHRYQKTEMLVNDFNIDSVRSAAEEDRYYGLNLSPHFYSQRDGGENSKATAEWRIFNQTMNPDRAQAFIATAVGIVEAVNKGTLRRVKLNPYNTFPVGGMFEGWRSESSVYTTFMRSLSLKVLSPADRRAIAYFWRSSRPVSVFSHSEYQIPGWYGEAADPTKRKKDGTRRGRLPRQAPVESLSNYLRRQTIAARAGEYGMSRAERITENEYLVRRGPGDGWDVCTGDGTILRRWGRDDW